MDGNILIKFKIILYDFSKANSDDSWWVAILKNNGYSAQTSGEITPYWWKINFFQYIERISLI